MYIERAEFCERDPQFHKCSATCDSTETKIEKDAYKPVMIHVCFAKVRVRVKVRVGAKARVKVRMRVCRSRSRSTRTTNI